ncbi:MAG: hypothetical protein F4Z31_06960 [Gemmatimonadetes bacterium]|nr:hypothetical protein [Gemmatimonadota bacterium]MCY3676210.1 hypothetical protein [Gemmatimonadota bacterium]MYA41473.1 hypothetical protein [Gemmatimonadota bacterium]MYE93227.1 hypothetical protein [Gemmatimonadota bacterium]MYJ11190.1 hypothetical protein [Gemmatimonadota bacterium]
MTGKQDQPSFAAAAHHRLASAVAPLLAALLASACHTYSPVTLSDVTPGDRVRTLLTQAQYEDFDEYLLGGDRVMEGTVIEADAGALLLEVPLVTVAEGIRVDSYSQRLRIPAQGVADVEIRSLSRGRTYALAGILGVAVGAIAWDQFRGSRRGEARPPIPPEEDIAVVIRISF